MTTGRGCGSAALSSRRSSGAGRPVATAASKHPTAGPSARSTQNRWVSVHTEPCHQIVASTGVAAVTAIRAHGHDRRALPMRTSPAHRMPIANRAARSGGDWITNSCRADTCEPRTPTAATTSVTEAAITIAPNRRTISNNKGKTTYSCASTAIDQNARLGIGALTRFCTSTPLTRTDFALGTGCPGGGRTSHATVRLTARAAQNAGRMRRARRRANWATPSSRQPWRAGARASEKPDSAMNTTTANRP